MTTTKPTQQTRRLRDEAADDRLTAEQLDGVAPGGLYGTEYWVHGEVGGWADVYDGQGNLVGSFASGDQAHAWILSRRGAPSLDG
jgi:hypothetical protein